MFVLAYKTQERLNGCEMVSLAAVRVTFVWQSWDKGCLLQEMLPSEMDEALQAQPAAPVLLWQSCGWMVTREKLTLE